MEKDCNISDALESKDPNDFSKIPFDCVFKKCCKSYKTGKRCKKCPKKK